MGTTSHKGTIVTRQNLGAPDPSTRNELPGFPARGNGDLLRKGLNKH